MKAFLLAAGRGSRLGSLTMDTPKCLLPIAGRTMLEHWFYLFNLYHVSDVLINTCYLADKVLGYCSKLVKYNIRIMFAYEPELLGTARTIVKNRDFASSENDFIIAYADTWLQFDLRTMMIFHRNQDRDGTIGVYRPSNLQDQGIVQIEKRRILSIEEKPSVPKDNFAFAGIMIGTHNMFKFYKKEMLDLAKDWLPIMKDYLVPFYIDSLVLDIGTPERYKEANDKIRSLGLQTL